MEGCDVPDDAPLGRPSESLKSGVWDSHSGSGYAAIYVGAGQRALDFTVDFCKTQRFEPDPEPRSHNPVVPRHVAEMTMALEGALAPQES